MQEKNFSPSPDKKLFQKISPSKSPKEQKQIRVVLSLLFSATALLVLLAIAYREAP